MEALATALRDRGFEVLVASDGLAERVAAVELILLLAGARSPHIVVTVAKYRLLFPKAIIMLVGAEYTDPEKVSLIEAGVQAFSSSRTSLDSLVQTITAVQRGESSCSPRLGELVASRIAQLARTEDSSPQAGLTPREQQILRLVATGLSNKEISQQLSISLHTVKIHVHRILEKLQVRRRREAARWMHARVSHA